MPRSTAVPDPPAHLAGAIADLVEHGAPAARRLPWRAGTDAWGVLVSEVMSQQTQAERAAARWRQLMERFPTPAHLADAEVGEIIALWVGLGYNRRAVNLHRAARVIVDDHAGVVPSALEDLLALPGIGPYTARAVLVFAHDHVVLPVDTNIARILARLSGRVLDGRTAQAWADAVAWRLAEGDVPPSRVAGVLMDFGAATCRARTPACPSCPVIDRCAWAGGGAPDPAARGDHRPRPQARFEGSLRQARGRLVDAMRSGPVTTETAGLVAGPQWQEALEGLVSDGLAQQVDDVFALPGFAGKALGQEHARDRMAESPSPWSPTDEQP